MKAHKLKTWPEYFEPIETGEKTFEVRFNDRNFKVGDRLDLQEWIPKTKRYTGRWAVRYVTYILPGGSMGIEEGNVIMGLKL